MFKAKKKKNPKMTVTNKRLQRLLIKEVVYRWKQHKTIKMRGIQKKNNP